DLAAGAVTHEVAAGEGAEGIEVAPDGSVWVANRAEDTVTVHHPDTLARIDTLESPGFPIRVVFTPDGRHALVTNAMAATMSVFDAAARTHVATVALRPGGARAGRRKRGQGPTPIRRNGDSPRPPALCA